MLASATLSDHLLQTVVWFSLCMLVLLLLLLLQIVLLRLRLIRRNAQEQRFLAVWQPLMAAAIAGEPVEPPIVRRGEELLFLKLWNHLQESLRGKAKLRLNALAAQCDILGHVHYLLHKNGLRPRLIALATLGHLGDRSVWNDILQLSREPDTLLSLAAIRALFQINGAGALHELLPQLLRREDWQTAQLAMLIEENASDNMYAYLADATARLAGSSVASDLAQLRRLLRLLHTAPPQHALPAVRRVIAKTTDEEVIAECLKFMREQADLPVVRGHIAHANWAVRLQAARALGRIGDEEDVARLVGLLSDPVWWVRYRAAQALYALKRGNVQGMAEIRLSLSDRYARDALEMVMAEQVML